jgi:hypothetical protein
MKGLLMSEALNNQLWKALEIGDLEQLCECGANTNSKGSNGLTKGNNTELIS